MVDCPTTIVLFKFLFFWFLVYLMCYSLMSFGVIPTIIVAMGGLCSVTGICCVYQHSYSLKSRHWEHQTSTVLAVIAFVFLSATLTNCFLRFGAFLYWIKFVWDQFNVTSYRIALLMRWIIGRIDSISSPLFHQVVFWCWYLSMTLKPQRQITYLLTCAPNRLK